MTQQRPLPQGWTWTTLGEVVEIVRGVSFDKSQARKLPEDGFIPVLRATNIQDERLVLDTEMAFVAISQVSESQLLRVDDIVICMSSGSKHLVGKTASLRHQWLGTFGSFCATGRARIGISPQFCAYFFLTSQYRKAIQETASGTNINNIRPSDLEGISLPLAPAEEQKRIAERLDDLFSELNAGLEAIEKARAKVKAFRASVLRAATSGELSAGWRAENAVIESGAVLLERILLERRLAWEEREGEKRVAKSPGKKLFEDDGWKGKYIPPQAPDTSNLPGLPESWCWASVEQLAAFSPNSLAIGPFGSNLKVSDYKVEGVPLVFVRHIRSGNFAGENAKYISQSKAMELSSHSVDAGDILITKMGEPPGDAALYPVGFPQAIITADCIKWRLHSGLKTIFFVNAINSSLLKQQIERITKGVAQQKISLDRFRGVGLPLPPLAEQEWIVGEVEQRLALASETEKALDAAQKRAQSLKAAILARAFRGELSEQDPDEESADALLERIRASRAEVPKRGGRGQRAKAQVEQGTLF